MKKHYSSKNPDVVMIYQDRTMVESAITQITELKLSFKTFKFDPTKLNDIAAMKPKVLLLSSNNVKNTIRFYIDYLEGYGQNIATHSAVLLINNRETSCAYVACENGLFDNYAIINPLNEPYRLKLVLLQELKAVDKNHNNSLNDLISTEGDELASCIEHGVALKKSFSLEVSKCEASILSATEKALDGEDAKSVIQRLIGLSLEEMNENVTANIEDILTQLDQLKTNHSDIAKNIESEKSQKNLEEIKSNPDVYTPDALLEKPIESPKGKTTYKILIAEASDDFFQVVKDILDAKIFNYLHVSDGQEALKQITAFNPDLVILGYDLPSINGMTITKFVRKESNTVPIIAYTHHRDKGVIRDWVTLGLSDYLIKPAKRIAILKSVSKALKNPIKILPHQQGIDTHNIKWIPEFSVGNDLMDEQHKMLFTMINEFFQQEGKEAAVAIFQNLTMYIDLHFEAEENLLKQINFPETIEHTQQHEELSEKFQGIQKKLDNYSLELHHKIALFLYNWLSKHILITDMEYKDYALSIEEDSFHS